MRASESGGVRLNRCKLLFAWYDLWVGAFWDRKTRKLYLLPVPCLGVVLDFSPKERPKL